MNASQTKRRLIQANWSWAILVVSWVAASGCQPKTAIPLNTIPRPTPTALMTVSTHAIPPASTPVWIVVPQQVTFVNDQGFTLMAWLFKPSGQGPFPAVVMLHGCSGVYSYGNPAKGIAVLYREWGDRLVKAGYVALLVDSFTPRKAPNQCGNGSVGVSEVNDRPHDAYAGLRYLRSISYVSANRIGLMGWSHGGSATMATMDETYFDAFSSFKAAVEFYPGCGMWGAFGGVNNSTWKPYAPLLLLIASADKVVKPSYCRTRVSTAQSLGAANLSLTAFTGAQHSFDMARSLGNGWVQADLDAKAAADTQALQFFATWLR